MVWLDARDQLRISRFIGGLADLRDVGTFAMHALRELSALIPVENCSYNRIDIRTGAIDVVALPNGDWLSPQSQQTFQRHIDEHPIIAHYARTHDGAAHRISDFLAWGRFRETALYREFYRTVSVRHQLAVGVADETGDVIGIALNRSRRDFSDRERAVLDVLRPHLAVVHRDLMLVQALEPLLRGDGQGDEAAMRELVVATPQGRILAASSRAERWLAAILAVPPGQPLRERLRAWLAEMRAAGRYGLGASAAVLQATHDGRRFVARIAPAAGTLFLLLEDRSAPADGHGDAGWHVRLSAREREVLACAAEGMTNRAIGERLRISPRTVQRHLDHVFGKLQVSTRTAAVTRAERLGVI